MFRQGRLGDDRTEKYPIRVLLESVNELGLKFMKDVKIAHLGLTILLRHFMMQLLYPLLTSLDLKTTSWSLFLVLSCALPLTAVIE